MFLSRCIIYPSSIYDFGLHNNIVIFQCVIDWLENCAQESINHYRENVHFSDGAVAW